MFGHNLPRCGHPCDRRCALASLSYYACAHVPYIILIYTYAVLRTALIRAILLVCLIFALKSSKKYSADFQQVTKKMHFLLHFFSKIFGQFKKKQYFCITFEGDSLAQQVEHHTFNVGVLGSSPRRVTKGNR